MDLDPARLGLAVALGALAVGCGGEGADPTCIDKNTCTLSIVSGDGQSAVVAEVLRAPLVVRVVDEAGAPAEVVVAWTVFEGEGTLSTDRTPTDPATGEASVEVTLGTRAGEQTFEATLEGLSGRLARFTVVARPAEAEAIEAVSGDGQVGTAGETLPEPLRVRLTDRFGNEVPDVPISWEAPAGGGATVPGPEDSARTDADGISTAMATLGPVAGDANNLFLARRQGAQSELVQFVASARAGPPAELGKTRSDETLGGQPGETLSTPLAVRVVDRLDNPVEGATVTFSVLQGEGATLSETSPLTGASGEAAVRATLGPEPGAYAFTAELGRISGSPVTFRATAFPPICSLDDWCWRNPLPQGNDIYGAWAASTVAAWVVGELGTILRWNGTAWVSEASNVAANLRDVHGASDALVHAVGTEGAITVFDGARWSSVPSRTTVTLEGVWMATAAEGWAVGEVGTILRYDGSGWAPFPSPTQENLRDVRGVSPTEVWAVGERGTFLRYDGTSWTVVPTTFDTDLAGVWPVSTSEVWVVGDRGSAYRYDGAELTDLATTGERNLTGLWRSPSGELYAFGLGNELERWDGSRWFSERTEASPGTEGIWAMLEVGGSVLAVGDNGRFLRLDRNGTWRAEASLGDEDLQAVWGLGPDRAWIVGDRSTVLEWDGDAWTAAELDIRIGFRAITGTSATDVWAVGQNGAAFRYDGTSWSEVRTPTDAELLGVWPVSANEVYAVGGDNFGGVAIRFDGATWLDLGAPADARLRGVYAPRSDLAWAVGGVDLILRWDGVSWTQVASPSTTSQLQGIRGRGEDDIWAWGTGGTILRYDGVEWRLVRAGGTNRINAVWPFSRDAAVAVGTRGLVLEWTSSGFLTRQSGASTDLLGVWGATPDDVWAVGSGGALLRRER